MSQSPYFVLIHGAWHTPHCWSKIIPLLGDAGYEVFAPRMPTSGSEPPPKTWDGDIEGIRECVTRFSDQGRDVVVVLHSNAGIIGGTALEGLDKKSREQKGSQGGVVRLVYICAFIVPEGFRHSTPGTSENVVPQMKVDLEKFVMKVEPEDVKGLLYQDLSDEEALEVAKTLVPQSLASLYGTTTYAAWRFIPTTYVLALKDAPTTVAAARYVYFFARCTLAM
jgi:pimeloyl-ACP methyl ester carboxylesterase